MLTRPARGGKPVPRPKGTVTPCGNCPKTEGQPARERHCAVDLSERNARAWRHYRECAAVGHFPDEPIVRRNAAIIREVLDAVAESRGNRLAELFSRIAVP